MDFGGSILQNRKLKSCNSLYSTVRFELISSYQDRYFIIFNAIPEMLISCQYY